MNIGVNLIGGLRYRWGGRVYAQNILEALAKIDRKNRYFLFLSSPQDDIFNIKQDNFQRIVCCRLAEKGDLTKLLAEQICLPLVIKKHRIDVLFSPCNLEPIFTRAKKIMVVQDLRFFYGVDSFWRNTIKKPIFKLVLKSCQKIIVASNNTYQDIVEFINIQPSKLKMIYDLVEVESFSQPTLNPEKILEKYKINKGEKYLLFVSAHYPWKNIHTLIEIFQILKNKYRILHKLVLVGSFDLCYTPQLKALARKLNLENDIFFLGSVGVEELAVFYQKADVFTFPSLFEGFGLPLVEAMASAAPIVAFDTTTSPEVIRDAGLLVEAGNEGEFAEAVWRIIEDKKLREDLINKGRERAKDFSPEKIAPQVLKEIEALYDK